jgi:hypothetical protein
VVCSTARLTGLIGCNLGMLSASFEEGDCHALAEPGAIWRCGRMATPGGLLEAPEGWRCRRMDGWANGGQSVISLLPLVAGRAEESVLRRWS